MSDLLHLNLANTALPLALLLALALALPWLLAGGTMSQPRLALAILATALALWLAGAALMALLYARINHGATGGLAASLDHSATLSLLWGPVLLVVWLMRAQGVERRRGLLMKDHP